MNSLEFTLTLANQDNKEDGHNLGSCHHLNNNNNVIIKNKGVSKKKTLEERKKNYWWSLTMLGVSSFGISMVIKNKRKGEALKVFEVL